MISPTPGRIVWFTPSDQDDETFHVNRLIPLAAIVCHVYDDREVNLTVFDSAGNTHRKLNVPLLQDDDPKPEGGFFCSWMPYQIGQAKKHHEAFPDLALKIGPG